MKPGKLGVAVVDAEPNDTDVLHRGEDAEAGKRRVERADRGVDNGCTERVLEGVEVVSATGAVAEELQREVGVLGIGEGETGKVGKWRLGVGDLGGESVEVDADEQSHDTRYAVDRQKWVAEPVRDANLTHVRGEPAAMTDESRDDRPHEFSEGQGFGEPHEGFDLDPPELRVDPSKVDPVDSRVIADTLDERQIPKDAVDAEALLDVGLEYIRIQRFEQATEALERAARFTDDDGIEQEAWVNKGAAHAELEEYDEAIGAYREALRIDDDSEHAATAETNLAYALWESGRTELALEHAERAVELDPRFPQAWYNRGFLLLERGLSEDAVTCFDNALRLNYRNPEVLEEKARALEELGEDDEAEAVLEEAEQLRQRAEERLVEER